MLVVLGLAAVYVAVFAIVGSSMFARAPGAIAAAATFDLTITATAIVWWFGVRRKAIRPWLAVVTLSWGVAAAKAHVPHAPLGMLVIAGIALEVLSLSWLLIRIRRVARAARAARDEGPIGALERGLVAAAFPARLAAIAAVELGAAWLALTGWFRRPAANALSMRSTGWVPFAGIMGFLIAGETVAVHLLLGMLSPIAAWISTVSTAYLLVWLLADIHAIRIYPVALTADTLHIRIGIRWRAAIPLAEIARVERITAVPDGADKRPDFANLALFEPTVLVTLRGPVELRGLLGRRRWAERLALTIDDPAPLIAAVG